MGGASLMKNLLSTELAHHGIIGQKWGKRNGPPYPLAKVEKGSAKYTNEIYSKLSARDKNLVANTRTKPPKQLIKPDEEKYILDHILVKYKGKPATALDIWNVGDGEAEVSIMTDPEFRGKKLADKAVEAANEWFNNNQYVRKLYWAPRADNIPSRKLAEKHGFEMIPDSTEKWDDWVVYAKNKDKKVSEMSVYD